MIGGAKGPFCFKASDAVRAVGGAGAFFAMEFSSCSDAVAPRHVFRGDATALVEARHALWRLDTTKHAGANT